MPEPEQYAYTGPSATVLRNGRHVAPYTLIGADEFGEAVEGVVADEDEGIEAVVALPDEREHYEECGWLVPVEPPAPLSGDALKRRAQELDVKGRSGMDADELRAAVEQAEHEAAAAAEGA